MATEAEKDEEAKDILRKILSTLEHSVRYSGPPPWCPVSRVHLETSVLDKHGVEWHWSPRNTGLKDEEDDDDNIIIREHVSVQRMREFFRETLVVRGGDPTAITSNNEFPHGSVHPLDEPLWNVDKKLFRDRRWSDGGETIIQIQKESQYGDSDRNIQRNQQKVVRGTVTDTARPTYIRVHSKWLDPETVDAFGLPWEWDRVS